MIVEFRALWFYGLYQQALKRARHALSLKRVLGEEQAHLGDMAERLEAGSELDDARAAQLLRRSAGSMRGCSRRCSAQSLSDAAGQSRRFRARVRREMERVRDLHESHDPNVCRRGRG